MPRTVALGTAGPDPEVCDSLPIDWEGASSLGRDDGAAVDRAYVELSGYCPQL